MSWYYANAGQRHGPVSDEEFFELVQSGRVHDDSLVWKQGMPEWRTYAEVAPSLPPPSASAQAAGGSVSSASVKLKPVPALGYGGFWLRAGARLIDGVILMFVGQLVAGMVLAMVMPESARLLLTPPDAHASTEELMQRFKLLSIMLFIMIGVGLVYDAIFLRKFGATPGKMALGLRVQRPDGSLLSVAHIIGRYFANGLSALILGIGYLIAAFDDEKRALHDHLCDTRVVRTR